MADFSIGQRVRVLPNNAAGGGEGEDSRIALIACIQDSGLVDVIYEGGGGGDGEKEKEEEEEEEGVSVDRLLALYPFESLSSHELILQYQENPSQLKEFGNQLFHVKDYRQAMVFYQLALQTLMKAATGKKGKGDKEEEAMLEIGTQVLVFNKEIGDFLVGMISGSSSSSSSSSSTGTVDYEVILSDDSEMVLSSKDLLELPLGYEGQLLQRSLYANLGKCALKRGLKGWAVRYSSLSLGITRAMIETAQDKGEGGGGRGEGEANKLSQLLADSLYLRGKALLQACRPARATLDCKELLSVEGERGGGGGGKGGEAKKKGKLLESEILTFKTKRQKENRKLAKEIAKWVDTSLTQANWKEGSGGNGGGGDLPLEGFGEEEDDEDETGRGRGGAGGGSGGGPKRLGKAYSVTFHLFFIVFIPLNPSLFLSFPLLFFHFSDSIGMEMSRAKRSLKENLSSQPSRRQLLLSLLVRTIPLPRFSSHPIFPPLFFRSVLSLP